MMIKLKRIDGSIHNIHTSAPDVIAHFNNGANYTRTILDQFKDDYYKHFITKDDKVFLDLGANVGLFTLHVTPWATKIVSVEPTPSHFGVLTHLTSQFETVLRVQAAVADKTGKTTFYTCAGNTTTNSLLPSAGPTSFEVNCISLPDLLARAGTSSFDFIKIDIEGSELVFLTDANIKLLSEIANKLFIEFHPCAGKSQTAHRNHYAALFSKYLKVIPYGIDALFCKKDPNKLLRDAVFTKMKEIDTARHTLLHEAHIQ